MEHLLNNPIWNALTTGNSNISLGGESAKHYERQIAFFAGLKDNKEQDFNELHDLLEEKDIAVLFAAEDIKIPKDWKMIEKKELLQMVFEKQDVPSIKISETIPLGNEHVGAMLDLTARTNPGPFLPKSIEFGNYEGIFEADRLVAMAGQRMKPGKYTEISAVCTDPEHTGKGYAAKLIRSQIQKITEDGGTPFLHVLPLNKPACSLYQKLGFVVRKELLVYVIEKESETIRQEPYK